MMRKNTLQEQLNIFKDNVLKMEYIHEELWHLSLVLKGKGLEKLKFAIDQGFLRTAIFSSKVCEFSMCFRDQKQYCKFLVYDCFFAFFFGLELFGYAM